MELDADEIHRKGWQMARKLEKQRLQCASRRKIGSRMGLPGV